MTAAAKIIKASPKAARKSQQAPVRTQAKNIAKVEKTAPAEIAAPVVEVVANDMVMTRPRDTGDRILLPARMEMSSLHEAYELLLSKYPPIHAKYILDGALLSVIDMAGIQLLISFIRSVTATGCKVEWDNYSVQVYQLASELGVASQLGD